MSYLTVIEQTIYNKTPIRMPMMTKFEIRKRKLLDSLHYKRKMDVQEAAELMGISPATTRRFFTQLENEGTAVRVHGGIQLIPETSRSYSYVLSNTRRIEAKARIATHAVDIIESGDLLFLDSGTTILKLAEALEVRLRSKTVQDLVVVTNSLVSYEILAPYGKVILVGGEVRLTRRDTCGHLAERALETLHVHKSFFGADAVHAERGLMATDEETCRMNGIVRRNTESVFVLADSEKFGRSSLMTYCRLDDVDLIITDDGLAEKDQGLYRNRGAQLDVVSMI